MFNTVSLFSHFSTFLAKPQLSLIQCSILFYLLEEGAHTMFDDFISQLLYKQQIFSMAVASLQYCSTCFTTFRKDCFMLSHAKLSKYAFIFGWQYWLFHYKDKRNKILCLIILYHAQKISSKSNTYIYIHNASSYIVKDFLPAVRPFLAFRILLFTVDDFL